MQDFADMSMEPLAAILTPPLPNRELNVVLVGGLAVSLYTDNRYLTKDIDIVDISYQKPATLKASIADI